MADADRFLRMSLGLATVVLGMIVLPIALILVIAAELVGVFLGLARVAKAKTKINADLPVSQPPHLGRLT